jgi:RNA polymerase-binding transcription factor DksA
MESRVFQDIATGLEETRANMQDWLRAVPETKQQQQLGASDPAAVESHIEVVDTSLRKIAEGTLGICEVCHEPVDEELLRMDYTSCVCLSHYSQAELRDLERDLELSQVVQRALLPQRPPTIPGLEIAGFSRPASIVGGDYFDFVQFKDGSHGVVIGDVSGHGVSAGLLMTSLQTAIQTLAPGASSPVEVLERLNRLFLHNINFTTFVTIFFGQYNPAARSFIFVSAGHNAGYHFRPASQEERWLPPTGPRRSHGGP